MKKEQQQSPPERRKEISAPSQFVGVEASTIEKIVASDDFCRLLRALKISRDFGLYFVRCNLPSYRMELVARLRAMVDRPVVEIALPEDYTFLSVLTKAANQSPADALLYISGLEPLLPSYDEPRRHQTLEIFNWQRGALARTHRTLVFWVSEYLVPLLTEGAPDFWDWRSGLFEFDTPLATRDSMFQTLAEGEGREEWNLSYMQKQEWMVLLRSLLEEYHGTSAMEISARGRTAPKLGNLHQSVGDYQNALEYFQLALKTYEALEDRAELATSYNNIGEVHRARGDYDAALQWYQKSVEIKEALEERAGLAATYSNIGKVYHVRGDYDTALQWHKKSLKIKESIGSRVGIAASYNEIGLIYKARGDYNAALQWYQKSVEIQEALEDRAELATSYSNIGSVQYARGDYDAAMQWYQKSLQIREALGDRAGLAISYSNIGSVQYARGDYAAAMQWYQKSVEINEALGNRPILAITLHHMGYIAKTQQDWSTALAYFTRSRELYQQIGLEDKAREQEALIAEVKKKIR